MGSLKHVKLVCHVKELVEVKSNFSIRYKLSAGWKAKIFLFIAGKPQV